VSDMSVVSDEFQGPIVRRNVPKEEASKFRKLSSHSAADLEDNLYDKTVLERKMSKYAIWGDDDDDETSDKRPSASMSDVDKWMNTGPRLPSASTSDVDKWMNTGPRNSLEVDAAGDSNRGRGTRYWALMKGSSSSSFVDRKTQCVVLGFLFSLVVVVLILLHVSSRGGGVDDSLQACVDNPLDWESHTGHTCAFYALEDWCHTNGAYGEGWITNSSTFSDWADVNRLSAVEACCACGGGR